MSKLNSKSKNTKVDFTESHKDMKEVKKTKVTKDNSDNMSNENVKVDTSTKSKSSSSKLSSSKSSKSLPVKVPEPEVKVEEEHVSDVEEVQHVLEETRKRREVSKDTVVVSMDEIINLIDEEIVKMRETSEKSKGVKFLRSLRKKMVTLKSDTCKVVKQKTHTKRKSNGNSGFLKPVKISGELASFTGWNPEDMKSRVDVTKYICKYISEHNLQNPENKREINADRELCDILGYDPEVNEKLTYPKMQGYLKKHFRS